MSNHTLQISMESILQYPTYYYQHGIRRAVQLVAPPLKSTNSLELPKDSILHYLADDDNLYGIPQDELILQRNEKLLMVDHVETLHGTLGSPKRTPLLTTPMIRDYHKKYRNTRWLRNIDSALRDPNTIIVENYGLLPHLYRYNITILRSYYKWWNIQSTLWNRVTELTKITNRQQYLVVKLPKHIPSRGLLMRGAKGITRDVLEDIGDPESLFLLELWKWFGEQRSDSVIAKTQADVSRMNLIFIDSGRWFVLNLGLVDSWRLDEDNSESASLKIKPRELQNRFLRLIHMVTDGRTTTEPVVTASGDADGSTTAPTTVSLKPIEILVEHPTENKSIKIKLKTNQDISQLPETPVEETASNIEIIDSAIEKELNEFDRLFEERLVSINQSNKSNTDDDQFIAEREPFEQPLIQYSQDKKNPQDAFRAKVDGLADNGLVTAADYRRLTNVAGAYEKLADPYGSGKTIAEAMVINPSDLDIDSGIDLPKIDGVIDESMLKSSLQVFDRKYVEGFLAKDIIRSMVGLQSAGIAVTGYNVEVIEDAMNYYEAHSVQLTPTQGKPSTIHFKIPKIKSDGTFYANGVRYRLRKQRGDLPIRKIDASTVALTSYYSKIFVARSERQLYNYSGWLTDQVARQGIDIDNKNITNLMFADVFDSNWKVPRIYSILSMRFRSFQIKDIEIFLDYSQRHKHFGEEKVKAVESPGTVVVGKHPRGLVVCDKNDEFYIVAKNEIEPIGKFETVMGLEDKSPIEIAELKVFGKAIPIGICLGYLMGINTLLEITDAKPKRIQTGERFALNEDEFALRFEDETLIFNRENKLAALVFGGYLTIEQSTRNYGLNRFNSKDIYSIALQQNRIGLRYLKELDLLTDLFVDPITEEILVSMKEPVQFAELLLRASELLLTDYAPDETDMAFMRIKGYERIAGTIYGEMIKAIRLYRARGTSVNAKIEIPPYAIWQAIQQDPAVKLVEESNPIHNLKEVEEVTYSGLGGRSSRSMTKETRVFHQNDMGVISEATKDSADVAITTFLTANPKLKNLRGLVTPFDVERDGVTSALSTSALVSPAADRDDPKRVNFISIQHSSGTHAKGYRAQPLRTGYERVISQRADDLFAVTAKKKGRVVDVTDRYLKAEYDDGQIVSYPIGRRYGVAAGVTYPHALKANLQKGQLFKEGDCLLYNENYFEPDPLDASQVLWKAGVLVTTALIESPETFEDSSIVSEEVSKLLETEITKVREITIGFDQVIHNLVNVGDAVDIDSILCTIEDAVTAQSKLFDETSIDTLRLISANNPRAKFKGTVEKIEFFYNGEFDDLSESLQMLAQQSDLQRKRMARDLGKNYTSGRVDGSLRIEGNALPFENAVIRVYITGPVGAGIGDKAVFGNQMKTIIGRVMSGANETISGKPIGAAFAMQSIDARMIQSPIIIGTTNVLLQEFSKRVVDIYRGKK